MLSRIISTLAKNRDPIFWLQVILGTWLLLVGASLVAATWDITPFLGTVLSTFLGAWLAFNFGKIQRDDERRKTEVAAGNRALFTLSLMYNGTAMYQKEIVEPYRGKPDAWLNLHVTTPLDEKPFFEIKELIFLLSAAPSVFGDMFLEQQRYQQIVFITNEHRRLVLTEAWPRMEKAGLTINDRRPDDEIRAILGPSVTTQLNVYTAAIIKNVDENEKTLREVFEKLRKALKDVYPDEKFTNIKFPAVADKILKAPKPSFFTRKSS